MKDEIKAFLVNIKSNEEWKQIYDYITNLQQENKQLKKKYENAVADYKLEKYKNSKAIEYIKNTDRWLCKLKEDTYVEAIAKDKLLEILGDKE